MRQGELNFGMEQDHPWFGMLDERVVKKFWEFHAKHPRFFEDLFMKYTRDAHAAKRKRFGAAMIIQRIRWYVAIEKVGTEGETYKINDHVGAGYARLAMIRYPELEGLFELRVSKRGRRIKKDEEDTE